MENFFLPIYYVILFPFDNVNVRLLYEKLCHLEDMQLRVQNQILVLQHTFNILDKPAEKNKLL